MTILAGDLKFFASALATDDPNGGGRMTATVVQDGVTNNVFPDIDVAARTSGRVQLRKVFAAVTSANADLLADTELSFREKPADPKVEVVAFAYGDHSTTRSSAIAQLHLFPYARLLPPEGYTITANGTTVVSFPSPGGLPIGTLVALIHNSYMQRINEGLLGYPGTIYTLGVVTANLGSSPAFTTQITCRRTVFAGFPGFVMTIGPSGTSPRCCGIVKTTATSTASAVSVAAVEAQLLPEAGSLYPQTVNGYADPANLYTLNGGKVPIFRPGDSVVLRDGGTSETAQVSFVNWNGALQFSAPLVNSYPTNSTVSSKALLGDMQGSIGPSFSQQTWTKAFSDTLIGSGISANYNRTTGVITTTNLGAETERWAIVFTSTTAFKLIGEFVGQVATGTIGAVFEPNNPITNTPYFSIPTAGWGVGWGISNTLRFNTIGARKPFWLVRTVSPSAPGGSPDFLVEICGTI